MAGSNIGGSAAGQAGGGNAATAGSAGAPPVAMGGSASAGAGSAGGAGDGGGGGGAVPVVCELAHAAGVETLTVMSGGMERKVRLFVPSGYDGHGRLPLVLNLHGSTDNADNFANLTEMEQVAEANGFAVSGLEAVAGMWNVPPEAGKPDDVAYASDTIEAVSKLLCIDQARVYATGFSGGGRMSSRLGCLLPDKIAAIGPVAGVRWPPPCPGRPVPVLAIHGLADGTNAYVGEGPEHPRWDESVEDAVTGWAQKNGCSPTRIVHDPAGALSTYSYAECQADASVELIRMDGIDHIYPTGEPLHAAERVWAFFERYSLP